ncbi:lysylphosphatidylglycerol synthase domain-containing protein [Flavisolibacter ginsengisoli]|uniref:Lysylphosphatidylglycerol synthase TM region n=1 Tax=Flavisolibacter ginsengisoli DSM 18119 TaxID=1121884 RepID=A0A1M5DEY9_9BACT|nr:lysylphosphatidylglycerol synthase domain-containing protein [Flavisolibacter ginsengisoli]SHF65485.1 Lysylphosphatidylglycerol synthase TM region [Flavisolibacter ginsengisoli DSM 18119]
MQLNKSIKIFINYFFGPILFAWLAFSIYNNIKHQPQLAVSWQQIQDSFHSAKFFLLLATLLLVFVNWAIEALKWRASVAMIQPIGFWQAFKAVLSGVTFSVTMPNRVGEYLGRVLYLPEGSRLKTISVTLVGSFAQLLTTLFAGVIGLVVLKKTLLYTYPNLVIWYQIALYSLTAIVLVLILIYFNVSATVGIFNKWIRNQKYLFLVEALNSFHSRLLMKILLLSILRYFVFIVQYILVFYLFEVNVSAFIIGWVMSVVFLAMAIVPSIALVEIGVRGEISLKLMGMYSANSLGIGLTSISVWLVNLVIPAIIGSLLLMNIKVFTRKGNTI